MSFDSDEQEQFKQCPVMKHCQLYDRKRECRTCGNPILGGSEGYTRPPKSNHCSVCNNCVRSHDHHCIILNNCIGRRNMKPFILFLIFSVISGISNFLNGTFHLFLTTYKLSKHLDFSNPHSKYFLILQALTILLILPVFSFDQQISKGIRKMLENIEIC